MLGSPRSPMVRRWYVWTVRRPKKTRAFFRIQKGSEDVPFGMMCKGASWKVHGRDTVHVPQKMNFIIAKGSARDDTDQEFANYVIMRNRNRNLMYIIEQISGLFQIRTIMCPLDQRIADLDKLLA